MERKVVLYIAMSVDGYIADSKGHVGWLLGENPEIDDGASYEKFIKNIDTVIMGWNTYHQIVTELSPGMWVYEDLKCYVITHRKLQSAKDIIFTDQNPQSLIEGLREDKGRGIWICGGAEIARALIQRDMIDCYHLSVIPHILGQGIRLFGESDTQIKLKLESCEIYNGITELIYHRREKQ